MDAILDGADLESGPSAKLEGPTKQGLVLDFEPVFKSLHTSSKTVEMQWSNVEYKIRGRTIINGVSGTARPGNVIALMGPSGAGKTTLLNILAGRVVARRDYKLTGELLVNGDRVRPTVFRKQVAYVAQEDALYPTATTRESLEFSASLRLPSSTTPEQRASLVDDMLESLGLAKVQHSLVGGGLIRGLSGGEKKRVAIGVELVSSPSVLFLDEPTSGLDSYSAWKVVRILNAIAASGCTILCSVHQPSSEVFNEFSHVVFLGQGNVIYQGPVGKVDDAFRAVGLGVPPLTNIADHIMILVQTVDLSLLPCDNEDRANAVIHKTETKTLAKASRHASLVGSFKSLLAEPLGYEGSSGERRPGIMYQSWRLSVREFKGLYRDTNSLIGRFGATALLSVLFAIIFKGAGDIHSPGYTAGTNFGALVLIYLSAMFGAAQPALLAFPLDRILFIRELGTNTYTTWPYFISKLIVELPLSFLTALLQVIVVYWAMALNSNFIYLVLSVFELMVAAVSTAYILGSVVADAKQGIEMAPVVFVPQFLFIGFFVSISQIPYWLQWVQWVVPLKYALNMALLNEFAPQNCVNPYNNATCAAWSEVLETNNVSFSLLWLYIVVLLLIAIGYRLVAFFILNRKASNFES